jgi:hypothetical protein
MWDDDLVHVNTRENNICMWDDDLVHVNTRENNTCMWDADIVHVILGKVIYARGMMILCM